MEGGRVLYRELLEGAHEGGEIRRCDACCRGGKGLEEETSEEIRMVIARLKRGKASGACGI